VSYVVTAPFVLPLGTDAALVVRTPAIAAAYHEMLLANQDRLAQWEPWAARPMSLDDTRAFLAASAIAWADGSELPVAIVVRPEESAPWQLAGSAGLRIDHQSHIARLGYWIDRQHEGAGLVRRAGLALLEYGFVSLSLARVEIYTGAGNDRSCALAQRLGFTLEGTLREAVVLPGARHDQAIYGLLAEEFLGA
jgi:RimJ/RimL family protein N-acetyltransferase